MTAKGTRSDELADFVGELRRRGYSVGTEQCVAAQCLLVALAAGGELPERMDDLAALLAPVLCSSRAEQENFPRLFRLWVQSRPGLFSPTRAAAEETDAPQPLPPAARPRSKSSSTNWRLHSLRRPSLTAAIALALLLITVAGYLSLTTSDQVLSGNVSDRNGQPVAGATVQLIPSPRSINLPKIVTDANGNFTLDSRPIDFPARIRITKTDYRPVDVPVSQSQQVTVTLFKADEVITDASVTPWEMIKRFVRGQRQPFAYDAVAATILTLGLILILMPTLLLLLRFRRGMELRRWRTKNKLRVFELKVGGADEQLSALLSLRRTALEMRRHRRYDSRALDVRRTVEKTLRAGVFTPAYAARPARPEYLVLIDRADPADQQARLAGEIMERLDRSEVFVEHYFFKGDPRLCRKDEQGAQFLSPHDLAARHPNHQLVICGDGAGFFHHLTGRPQRWSEAFSKWPSRVLLTPEFDPDSYRNRALAKLGFSVLPAGRAGFMVLGAAAERASPCGALDIKPVEPLPELLRARPARWLENYPPDRDELALLASQLENFLDTEGYFLLGACAVYPQLLWDLTLAFGGLIVRADKLDETFARLLRLPWFRVGSMPDWLRELLIGRLGEREEQLIRGALRKLLESSLQEQPEGFILPLILGPRAMGATPGEGLFTRLSLAFDGWKRSKLFEDLRRTEPDDSPLNDYVLVEFMRGRKPSRLGLSLPESLRPVLYPRKQPSVDDYLLWLFLSIISVAYVLVLIIIAIAAPLPGFIIAFVACVSIMGLSSTALLQLTRRSNGATAPTAVTGDAAGKEKAGVSQLSADKQPLPLARLAWGWLDRLLLTWKLLLKHSRRPELEQPEALSTSDAAPVDKEYPANLSSPPEEVGGKVDESKSEIVGELRGAKDELKEEIQQAILQSAARAARNRLRQLPAPPRDFTGRARELAELRAGLRSGGVTISGVQGMGGVGKTALALKLAHEFKDQYPDAQIFLDLKGVGPLPLSPADVMWHVVSSFQPDVKRPDDDQLPAWYNALLNDQRVLLFYDNAASAEQIKPLVPPANCLLIVTSRKHFKLPGMVDKDLNEMSPADAEALLLENAPRIAGDAAAVAKQCGYLPLALRLVASALNRSSTLAPTDLVRRMQDRGRRVELIEASLGLSYELLTEEQRRRWRELAIFPGDFDAGAAAAVWQLDVDAARDALAEFEEYSLLEWEEATRRYCLHELARDYADTRLSDDERYAARARHAMHYAGLLADANQLCLKGSDSTSRGLALFDAEVTNIEAGQAWASRHYIADEIAAQLCSAYPDSGAYLLDLRLHPRDLVKWLELGVAAARSLNDRLAEGRSLDKLGRAYADLGDVRRALEFFELALSLSREIGHKQGEGDALGNLGIAYAVLGEPRRALEFFEQQLMIAREIGERHVEGRSLGNLGMAYASLNETSRAIEFYERALAIARETDDIRAEGNALGNLGLAYAALGETRRAIECYELRLSISRRIGDRRGLGSALFNMSVALERLGEREHAVSYAEEALKIFEEIESPLAASVRKRLESWRL